MRSFTWLKEISTFHVFISVQRLTNLQGIFVSLAVCMYKRKQGWSSEPAIPDSSLAHWPNNSQYSPQPRKSHHFSWISFLFPKENTSSLAHRNAVTGRFVQILREDPSSTESSNPILQTEKQDEFACVRTVQLQKLTWGRFRIHIFLVLSLWINLPFAEGKPNLTAPCFICSQTFLVISVYVRK